MCGRFTLTQDRKAIIDDLDVAEWEAAAEHRPRFNVAPTQPALTLTGSGAAPGSHRVVHEMRWGLVPGWAADPSTASKRINARAETLVEKPSFRNLVPRRRCVVVADGFFEWQRSAAGAQPYYIHTPGRALLPMAGLWDRWKGPGGEVLTTFTIVTTAASNGISWLHDRMPAILERGELDGWLDTERVPVEDAMALIKPFAGALEIEPVSKLVNSPRYDSAEVIRRVEPEPAVQGSLDFSGGCSSPPTRPE